MNWMQGGPSDVASRSPRQSDFRSGFCQSPNLSVPFPLALFSSLVHVFHVNCLHWTPLLYNGGSG